MSTDQSALRTMLMRRAERDSAAIIAAAEAEAARIRAAAQRDADSRISAARTDAELLARRQALAQLRAARSRQRQLVLDAEHTAEQRLGNEAVAAVLGLRATKAYPALLESLSRIARSRLGSDALLAEDAESGGLVARAGSRTLDLTLQSLALRALGSVIATVGQRSVAAA